jgi:3-methyl-2-oxobutanoate hydroxymethyltransferase
MSTFTRKRRTTVPQIRARKGGEPIACLTAYTAPVAKHLDPHLDLLLVGDSMAMVIYGMDSTVGVTVDMMIAHGKAVVRATEQALVVVDLPFGSYQESPQQAFRTAAKVMAETGCQAIKIEGGREMAETVRFLTERGVPVLAHVGLMPQSVNTAGGFKARGRDDAEAQRIIADAEAIAEAGAFAIVVEGTLEPVAREITRRVDVPTIGIGASPSCDGQILVTDDLVGMFTDFKPKFVKRYANLGDELQKAAAAFADDVRNRRFPEPEQCFGIKTPAAAE